MKLKYLFFIFALFVDTQIFAADWQASFVSELKNGGALVVSEKGETLLQHRANDHFIPASTIKVATAAAALAILGPDFRFTTDFYTTSDGTLFVKGHGDPALVSEEWAIIAQELKLRGITQVSRVVVDDSDFSNDIVVDGASQSLNPYDAVNGALIANFNTANVIKSTNGSVRSAESQTPMTPLVRTLSKSLRAGTQRVNIGKTAHIGARYAGEILSEFLLLQGVRVTGGVELGQVPSGAQNILEHKSTKTLEDAVRGLLDFSTNFTANQLFLFLGKHQLGGPATVDKGLRVLKNFLSEKVGWQNFAIAEGSGLSRQNQVTPRQMMALLEYFQPYRDLLPMKEVGAYAAPLQSKTGTLTGVNSLVGYFGSRTHGLVKFVVIVNSPVPYDYKFKLGKILYDRFSP